MLKWLSVDPLDKNAAITCMANIILKFCFMVIVENFNLFGFRIFLYLGSSAYLFLGWIKN